MERPTQQDAPTHEPTRPVGWLDLIIFGFSRSFFRIYFGKNQIILVMLDETQPFHTSISALHADLILVKGKLEAQEAEKRLLKEKYARTIQSLKDEALRWFGKYLDVKLQQKETELLEKESTINNLKQDLLHALSTAFLLRREIDHKQNLECYRERLVSLESRVMYYSGDIRGLASPFEEFGPSCCYGNTSFAWPHFTRIAQEFSFEKATFGVPLRGHDHSFIGGAFSGVEKWRRGRRLGFQRNKNRSSKKEAMRRQKGLLIVSLYIYLYSFPVCNFRQKKISFFKCLVQTRLLDLIPRKLCLLLSLGATHSSIVVIQSQATSEASKEEELLHLKYTFTFFKVFCHEASQQDIFFRNITAGACIFAYGQTGYGKTYTMMGRPEPQDEKGLIPCSLEQIFQTSQSLQSQGWKYKMHASMLEIYNETIRDLLATNWSSIGDMIRANNGAGKKQYAIKHDANGNTHVYDLTIVDVSSIKDISSLLHQAVQSRCIGKTQMNEQSSRSHVVFTLRILGVNEGTEQQFQGVLNLIDLAGSERLSKSGATGDRLKETQAINKSLSSLTGVIFALTKKEDHVPFRNSNKLISSTYEQPCLGGDSKTLMFVNISPDPSSVGESLCSLKFAARVNDCLIGIPQRQTTMWPIDSHLSYG
ncbi:hypothetical protein UlMin_011339 [Ulmus minor]